MYEVTTEPLTAGRRYKTRAAAEVAAVQLSYNDRVIYVVDVARGEYEIVTLVLYQMIFRRTEEET